MQCYDVCITTRIYTTGKERGVMNATYLAQYIVNTYSPKIGITNLKLNKLLYYIQVESLRTTGEPVFENTIEAWSYGPVVPEVYRMYRQYGREVILPNNEPVAVSEKVTHIVEHVVNVLGSLTAYDLVMFSHKQGGAWSRVYRQGSNMIISIDEILASDDTVMKPQHSLADGIEYVKTAYPNALRLLQNS